MKCAFISLKKMMKGRKKGKDKTGKKFNGRITKKGIIF